MAFDAHANGAYSTVATAPSPATSGTSLVVAAGHGVRFPAVPFNATIWPAGAQPVFSVSPNAEIVRVTGISTDTLTITRAQESTTARTVVVGDQIAATITAKAFSDIEVSPTFTGTLTTPDAIVSDDLVVGAAAIPTGLASAGSSLNVSESIHAYSITSELLFIGTGLGFAGTIDLRRLGTGGGAAGTFADFGKVASGNKLGGMHIGGTTETTLRDCAQIVCFADADFADAGSGATPTRWEFYTSPLAGPAATQTLALTIDSDLKLIGAGAASFAGALDVTGATALTGALEVTGLVTLSNFAKMQAVAGAPTFVIRRINGTLASPTAIASGNTVGAYIFSGQYSTTVGQVKTGAQIAAVATSTWSGTTTGGAKLVFSTIPDSGAIATAMTLDQNQGATFAKMLFGTPEPITFANGANNNVNVTSSIIVVSGPTAAFNITGFTVNGATPTDGAILILINTVTGFAMTITHDATSTAANRIFTNSGADIVQTAGGGSAVTFIYNATESRWRVIAAAA